jgi:hypothetical protein
MGIKEVIWKNNTVTAGNYTLELHIDNKMWENFQREVVEDTDLLAEFNIQEGA